MIWELIQAIIGLFIKIIKFFGNLFKGSIKFFGIFLDTMQKDLKVSKEIKQMHKRKKRLLAVNDEI